MATNWHFSPILLAVIAPGFIASAFFIYAWRRRKNNPGIILLGLLCAAVAEWSFGYVLELAAATISLMTFWAQVEYIGITATPVAWALYALHYTGREKWLTRRNYLLFSIIPILTVLLVFTNSWHHLIWQNINKGSLGHLVTFEPDYGWWFWIHTAYSYGCIILGSVIMLQAFWETEGSYRSQAGILLFSALSPWISNILFLAGVVSFDLTPLAFAINGAAFLWGVQRWQLFKIAPIARRVAVDNMVDGLLVLDLENHVVDINPAAAALLDMPGEKIIGLKLEQFAQVRQFMETQPEVVNQFRNNNDTTGVEVVIPHADQDRWYDIRISPLNDQRQHLRGHLVVIHDITPRKRVEQELILARDQAMRANQVKTEFIAKVSHELRTPLNAILGYAEMLQEGMYGAISETQQKPTSRIIKSTQFLARQVNDLLDMSKLEAGKLAITDHPFSPVELLERVQGQIGSTAQAKGLTLVMEVDSDVPPILLSDMSRLEQILINLIDNAIKFTAEGEIGTHIYRASDTHWALKVKDSGQGIPPEMQKKIFEPFQQGHEGASIASLKAGTGLGLAIVKQLVDLMQGSIAMHSAVGQGTTFTLLFPLVTPP